MNIRNQQTKYKSMKNKKDAFDVFIEAYRKLDISAEAKSQVLDLACTLSTDSFKEGLKEGARIWKV